MHTSVLSWEKNKQRSSIQEKTSCYVLFRIARQNYALPLTQVIRVLRMVAVTTVPDMPDWLSGMINVAGQTLAVLDLRRLLGQPGKEPEIQDRLLIIQSSQVTAAVSVDEVLSIQNVSDAQIELPQQALSTSRLLSAIIRQDESLIMVLDAQRLFLDRLEKLGDIPL